MELIKDPSHKANTTEKAVERFVNGSMGFRPGNDNPEASFYAQKIYDFAKEIVNTDPMASTNHELFHYTGVHPQNDSQQNINQSRTSNLHSDFLKTNRLHILMRSPRISEDPNEKVHRRTSFNSAYELCKVSQSSRTAGEWQPSDYRFDCSDRKQEYSALEDFNHDMYNTKLNKRPRQLQPVKVSLLQNANYVNSNKYGFSGQALRTKGQRIWQLSARGRQTNEQWRQYYKKDGKLVEQAGVSVLLQEKTPRFEIPEQMRLQLTHRPLKSDALERQKVLGQARAAPVSRRRAASTRFSNCPRGVYDILYPRSTHYK